MALLSQILLFRENHIWGVVNKFKNLFLAEEELFYVLNESYSTFYQKRSQLFESTVISIVDAMKIDDGDDDEDDDEEYSPASDSEVGRCFGSYVVQIFC